MRAGREQDIGLERDQFRGQHGQPVQPPLREPSLDHKVVSLAVAELGERPEQGALIQRIVRR